VAWELGNPWQTGWVRLINSNSSFFQIIQTQGNWLFFPKLRKEGKVKEGKFGNLILLPSSKLIQPPVNSTRFGLELPWKFLRPGLINFWGQLRFLNIN